MDSEQQLDLEFDGEFLVPRINQQAYRDIYTLEGWLRRLCLASWMRAYGGLWRQHLEPKLRRDLERLAEKSRQRLHLDAETSGDLIWQSDLGQLLCMLNAPQIADDIGHLAGQDQQAIARDFDEIREIRNVLAHNRALSPQTYALLRSSTVRLQGVVDHFRSCLLYANRTSWAVAMAIWGSTSRTCSRTTTGAGSRRSSREVTGSSSTSCFPLRPSTSGPTPNGS